MTLLERTLSRYLDPIKTWDDIKNFFSKYGASLEYLEEYEGLDNFLGSGVNGKVWKLKNQDLTVKITDDPNEIEVANAIVGRNITTFLKIYKVVNINAPRKAQFRVQEMAHPLPEELEEICELGIRYFPISRRNGWKISLNNFNWWLSTMEDEYIRIFYFLSKDNKEEIDNIKTELQNLVYNEQDNIKKVYTFLEQVNRDIEKLNITDLQNEGGLDLHGENIMLNKDGNLILVDF